MAGRIPGFKGEYLWELEIAEHHLKALAAGIPGERYEWRPAETARAVSAIFVHIAAGNLALLDMIGASPAHTRQVGQVGPVEQVAQERFLTFIMQVRALETSVTAKADVVTMLADSLTAWRDAFTSASDEELDRVGAFFGEQTTVRRVYLRLLAHAHEHMGQLIGYVRMMGLPAPWPDPVEQVKAMLK
jgi:uncharacterized damage-inducible protein DinB